MSSQISERRQEPDSPASIAEQVIAAISGIQYGSVELVIHQGKVVQIERKEKLRLDPGERRS